MAHNKYYFWEGDVGPSNVPPANAHWTDWQTSKADVVQQTRIAARQRGVKLEGFISADGSLGKSDAMQSLAETEDPALFLRCHVSSGDAKATHPALLFSPGSKLVGGVSVVHQRTHFGCPVSGSRPR